MIILLIFVILAASNAERLVRVPMGYLDVVGGVGEVPLKYDPLEPTDIKASVNATKWAVSVIPFIPTGTPEIPLADPWIKEKFSPLDVQNTFASGKIYVKNLVVRGMRDIMLNNLEMRLKTNRVDVTVSVPIIVADVDYSAALKAGFLPVTYDGHARILMEDVTVHVTTKSSLKKYKGMAVVQIDAIALTVHARNLDLSIGEDVWNIVGKNANVLFEEIIQQSMTTLAKTIMSNVNQILRLVPSQAISQYLGVDN